jgi:predicted nicotinamide N-methyase
MPDSHVRPGHATSSSRGSRASGARHVTRTIVEEIEVGAVRLELERPADAESLLDEKAFAVDEYLPYWAERWASGVALAEHVATLALEGERVLELGCGLGLPSLVAARRGAEVVATDWSSDAIALLERNAARNGVRLTSAVADWREPDVFVQRDPFDLVLAADVLYEERNVDPILALLERLAVPALVADPGRRHAGGFLDAGGERWDITTEEHELLPLGGIHLLLRPS